MWSNEKQTAVHIVLLTLHDTQHHITFTQNIRYVQMTWMGAAVNDSIHIQIKMIKLGKESTVRDDLIDLWITLRDPSVKLKE